MAEDLAIGQGEAAVAPVEAAADAEPVLAAEAAPFERRFGLAYVVLAVLAALAVVVLVAVLVARDDPPWAAWEPAATADFARVEEIASFVANRYKLGSGAPLLSVTASPLRVQDTPVIGIVVRRPWRVLDDEQPVEVMSSQGAVTLLTCGFGESCAIEGAPSEERGRLVRRLILETALYTFHYVDDARLLVGFLPPTSGVQYNRVLLLRRSELEPLLDRPLARTLSPVVPLPNTLDPDEARLVDRLTEDKVFRGEFQELQNGAAALVLSDLSLPAPATQPAPAEPAAPAETTPAATTMP
jgi:hypothetical protein